MSIVSVNMGMGVCIYECVCVCVSGCVCMNVCVTLWLSVEGPGLEEKTVRCRLGSEGRKRHEESWREGRHGSQSSGWPRGWEMVTPASG